MKPQVQMAIQSATPVPIFHHSVSLVFRVGDTWLLHGVSAMASGLVSFCFTAGGYGLHSFSSRRLVYAACSHLCVRPVVACVCSPHPSAVTVLCAACSLSRSTALGATYSLHVVLSAVRLARSTVLCGLQSFMQYCSLSCST